MKRASQSKQGFKLFGILLFICIGLLVIGCGLYFWHQRIAPGDIKLSGTISSDTCSPDYPQIPDTGCSITVNGYSIGIEEGFSALPFRGKVTGQDGNSLKGRRADVYAENDGSSKVLDISSDSKYYVHIH